MTTIPKSAFGRGISFWIASGPRLRRLRRRGISYAVLSLLAFSAGTVLVLAEWQREVDETHDTDEHLRKIVTAQHIGRRQGHQIGVVSLLLADANQAGTQELTRTELDRPWSSIVRSFAAFHKADDVEKLTIVPAGDGALLTANPDNAVNWDAYYRQVRPYRIDRDDLHAPLAAMDPVHTIDGFTLGPAGKVASWTHQQEASELGDLLSFLPSTAVFEHWTSTTTPKPPGIEWSARCDAKDPKSRVFPCPHGRALRALSAMSQGLAEQPDLVQAYFIGPNGDVALWGRNPKAPQTIWREPLMPYHSGSYIMHFLQRPRFVNEDAVVITPAYFDFLGVGLVRTLCTPFHGSWDATDKDWPLHGTPATPLPTDEVLQAGPKLEGLLCLDVQVPVIDKRAPYAHIINGESVPDPIVGIPGDGPLRRPIDLNTPLFDVSYYCQRGESTLEYDKGDRTCGARDALAKVSESELQLISKAVGAGFERGGLLDATVDLPEEKRGAAASLLGIVPGTADRVVVLLRPRVPGPRSAPLVAAAFAFALATLTAMRATGLGQMVRSRLTLLELLRSVPAGVAMLNSKGEILFGNDRAEELLGVPLPTYWDEDEDVVLAPQVFARFVDKRHTVQLFGWTEDGSRATGPANIRSSLFWDTLLPNLRKRGRPYRYLAHLARDRRGDPATGLLGQTLDVRGTPVLRSNTPRSIASVVMGQVPADDWFALGVFDIAPEASSTPPPET